MGTVQNISRSQTVLLVPTYTTIFNIFIERIMADALEDHLGHVGRINQHQNTHQPALCWRY